MKLNKYINEYNGAPFQDCEFAELGLKVKDNPEFVQVCENFLNARAEFYATLDTIGVEMG